MDDAREELSEKKRSYESRLEVRCTYHDSAVSCIYVIYLQELVHERDGYKDAMMQSYEHVDEKVKQALAEAKVQSVPPQESGGGGLISGLLGGSNKQTLQELASLKKQLVELKGLEKLRPQILQLQQKLAEAEKSQSEMEKRLTQDNVILSEHNEELIAANSKVNDIKADLEKEVEVSKGLVIELTERVKILEGEGRKLQVELKESRLEVEYVRSTSADPSIVSELEAKIKELLSKY